MGHFLKSQLFLFNSLSKKKEQFIPINSSNIRMYVCGPTVYDYPHLGNIRSAVVYDIILRVLLYLYNNNVTYVRNITDIDDKIINKIRQKNWDFLSLTGYMTSSYHEDLRSLGCIPPNHEPKATSHISDMIAMITQLISLGHAYVAEKHVLFDVTSCPSYGILSKRDLDDMLSGARVEVAPFKKNPQDFVLWKPIPEEDKNLKGRVYIRNDLSKWEILRDQTQFICFDSPWGLGRPGWHIECSAMSSRYLGSQFDIHGGGMDLIFPHHENEIAQSTCAFKLKNYANYWLHNGFINIKNDKMSKTDGNFVTFRDAINSELLLSISSKVETRSLIMRYFYISGHYRKPISYHPNALIHASNNVQKIINAITPVKQTLLKLHQTFEIQDFFYEDVISSLCDDINTSKVFDIFHTLISEIEKNESNEQQLENLLNKFIFICSLLGLNIKDLSSADATTIKSSVNTDCSDHNEKISILLLRLKDVCRILSGQVQESDTLQRHIIAVIAIINSEIAKAENLITDFLKCEENNYTKQTDLHKLLSKIESTVLDELIKLRNKAKGLQLWKEADFIRNVIKEKLKYEIRDNKDGSTAIHKIGDV